MNSRNHRSHKVAGLGCTDPPTLLIFLAANGFSHYIGLSDDRNNLVMSLKYIIAKQNIKCQGGDCLNKCVLYYIQKYWELVVLVLH